MARSPSPTVGRPYDIEIGTHEVITIDLDALETDPSDLVELMKDSENPRVWGKLAAEYWRQGHPDIAEHICREGLEAIPNGTTHRFPAAHLQLAPLHALLSNLQLAKARKAPKLVLTDPRQDNMTAEKSQEHYYKEVIASMNSGDKVLAESGETWQLRNELSLLTRGISQLAMRNLDDAQRSFEAVLSEKPTNLVALMGKARILYFRRQFAPALKLFQQVLSLNPSLLPDPRVGIGLCLWSMGEKQKARQAWQRSLEVNPTSWPAQLLLGLDSVNASRNEDQTDAERARAFVTGTKLVERAFNANQRNASAANALCDILVRKGQLKKAMKLAERTIQFADTLTLLTEGYTRAGRVAHAEGDLYEATKNFTLATEGSKTAVASVGLAQVQIKNDEFAAAIHTLDTLLQQPSMQKSLEATVMLASLRAHSRPGVSSTDAEKERAQARELFDVVCKALDLHLAGEKSGTRTNGHANGTSSLTRAHRRIAEDIDMHAEIARLWQSDDLTRAKRALREGLRLSEATPNGRVDPRLLNNLGAIHHLEGDLPEARSLYEKALTIATTSDFTATLAEAMSTSVLYNLGRAYEDVGEGGLAKDAYEKLLTRHPEYTDAKIRVANIFTEMKQFDAAHDMLKQSLTSHQDDLNLRAAYTHFLILGNLHKNAKEFVYNTLKDFDKHDVYALCAFGYIQYNQARDPPRDVPHTTVDRKKWFKRAAEFFEKALSLDPACAFAAQGLAIGTAEDSLGSLGGALGPIMPDEHAKRTKNARDALEVFAKVRESINEGSVYVNMGHCYFNREEFDRAIESYETASKRYYGGRNVATLLCLCRAWYAKSNKDQSFAAVNNALKAAQEASHIQPQDKAILYNIAMIQQKAAQMLFAQAPAKRTLKDLQRGIEQATQAQKLFASLASDPSPMVPYDKEMADERRKYGESVLRKADEHLAAQRQYDAEVQTKLDAARNRRQQERDRILEAQEKKLAEERQKAETLADQRRIAREQALAWTNEVKIESDEEKEKKAKRAARKATKADIVDSGEEGAPEPKKRRMRRKKAADTGDEDSEALFSANEDEGENKPVKKRQSKKRVVRDEDDDEVVGAPRRKQIKSKEVIEDSDEEMA